MIFWQWVWIQIYPSPSPVALLRLGRPVCPTSLIIEEEEEGGGGGGGRGGCMTFLRVSTQNECKHPCQKFEHGQQFYFLHYSTSTFPAY